MARLIGLMRPRILALLIALATFAAPRPASALAYGDTLTTIMRPLPNLPALVQRGHAFTVWALAPSGASNWSASLQLGALTVPLRDASAQGERAAHWDGRNDEGEVAPPAMYLMRLRTGHGSRVVRLVLVR